MFGTIFNENFNRHRELLFEALDDNWEDKVDLKTVISTLNTSGMPDSDKFFNSLNEDAPEKKITIFSYCTKEFWNFFNKLPQTNQKKAKDAYKLFKADPHHPSLHFKPLKRTGDNVYSISIGSGCRAIGIMEKKEGFSFAIKWLFIGNHNTYDEYNYTLNSRLKSKVG
jgi:hypothetical protein